MSRVLLTLLFAITASALDNGVGRTPALGWNTWLTCDFNIAPGCVHDACEEGQIKAAATAMQQNGMQALGFNYVNMGVCSLRSFARYH